MTDLFNVWLIYYMNIYFTLNFFMYIINYLLTESEV